MGRTGKADRRTVLRAPEVLRAMADAGLAFRSLTTPQRDLRPPYGLLTPSLRCVMDIPVANYLGAPLALLDFPSLRTCRMPASLAEWFRAVDALSSPLAKSAARLSVRWRGNANIAAQRQALDAARSWLDASNWDQMPKSCQCCPWLSAGRHVCFQALARELQAWMDK